MTPPHGATFCQRCQTRRTQILKRWFALLASLTETLAFGLKRAGEVGGVLLRGRSLAIWERALTEGPPEALDVTLASLALPDQVAQEANIIWAPAASLAADPRPWVRLVGLTSRAWPRHQAEDALLPNHIVDSSLLDPLPVHQADRRDFDTILKTTARQVVCSRARRDTQGRINGVSPLYPKTPVEIYRQRARIPEHAAGWTDRLFARPAEFEGLPVARSARSCWIDWHTERLTAHDGLIRANHPLVVASLNRRQSATSLAKLLRDPLGYLWTYGFLWKEPDETEEPLQLDPLAIGGILHATLERAVSDLELAKPGGFGTADDASIAERYQQGSQFCRAGMGTHAPRTTTRDLGTQAARHSHACGCCLGIPRAIARRAAKLGRNTVWWR